MNEAERIELDERELIAKLELPEGTELRSIAIDHERLGVVVLRVVRPAVIK